MTDSDESLWRLIDRKKYIAPDEIARAVECEVQNETLDYRTRLLIRDSITALRKYWGEERLNRWLARSSVRGGLERICSEDFEEVGFPSLEHRIMEPTRREDIEQLLRDLDAQLHKPVTLYIGGSCSLILLGKLSRTTEDIDIVDEVPPEIRNLPTLDEMFENFDLRLAHFQSHYLPNGWKDRVQSIGPFVHLTVFVVDPNDVFVGKLFSSRQKDRIDLRILARELNKEIITERVSRDADNLKSDPKALENAQKNWYVLFGERTLP